jgi:hypothetical protein
MKQVLTILACLLLAVTFPAQSIIAEKAGANSFPLQVIMTDPGDHALVALAAGFLKPNSETVTAIAPQVKYRGIAIPPFPVTSKPQKPGGNAPHVEYGIYTLSQGEFTISAFFSLTLNFCNKEEKLHYAFSVDNDEPQFICINKEDRNTGKGIWNKCVAENIIIKQSKHTITSGGKHIAQYWMVDPAVVLQKLVLDFGETKKTYLGKPKAKH